MVDDLIEDLHCPKYKKKRKFETRQPKQEKFTTSSKTEYHLKSSAIILLTFYCSMVESIALETHLDLILPVPALVFEWFCPVI